MDRLRFLYAAARGVSGMRVASLLTLMSVSVLIVYSVIAAPSGEPSEAPRMGWTDDVSPGWTPISTSTHIETADVRIPAHRERQHLFVSRVRVRSPEFEGLYVLEGEDGFDYLQAGAADIAIHAATDLVDVVPRGRYYVGEVGSGESSNWLVDYEDLPLLIRTQYGGGNTVCVRPWNWFQLGSREAFLELEHGESGYHSYSWPAAWRQAMSDLTYPGIEPTNLHSEYNEEMRAYAFGHDRDEIFMEAGSDVLFRDIAVHNADMPNSFNISSVCGDSAVRRQYSDSSLYQTYIESSPGTYGWRFAGMSVDWVYVDEDSFDLSHVPYSELPTGNIIVGPEMVYADSWPRMEHPDLDDSGDLYGFSVLDKGRDAGDRSFRLMPDSAKSDLNDVYGDGKIQIIETSISPEDVCGEFTVQVNAIEYTASYVAAGVEAHCVGVGANHNHLPMLIRDSRVASLHPFVVNDKSSDCDPESGQTSRECFDVNVGIEGRVIQRESVHVYLYYRIYEQRYIEGRGWQDLDTERDQLVITNDPDYQRESVQYNGDAVRLVYMEPEDYSGTCDYKAENHGLFDQRPDDEYVGSFRASFPSDYRVGEEDARRKRFGVYLEVDMIHQVEIGDTGPGKDYRVVDDGFSYDSPGCTAAGSQIGAGHWNYSERKLCPDGDANCALWMGPPAKWKSFDLLRITATPTP